jgi:tetratricopeptide (TPR) repeat protein
MTDAAHDQARMFAAWLATRDPDMERIAITMGGVSEPEWEAIASALPAPFEADTVGRVICRAHELLGKAPTEAQSLASLALRMTRQLNAATCSDLPLIEGDAWRECAAAHLEMAEFDDAYQAIARARVCYARSRSSRINAAILLLIEGRTLFELGRSSEALAAVDLGSSELLDSGADRKKYVHARIIRASILMGMGQPDAALDVFSAAADLATQTGDNETLAHVLSNIGLCVAKLGDTRGAKLCFESALQLFYDLGLRVDMPGVRTAMVSILKVQRRHNEAISELFKVRAEYLSLGIPVRAAISSLEIVGLMLVCDRCAEVPPLCSEMVRTFTKARLQKNLLKALAYLDEVARRRLLAASDVTYVASFIERAQDDPRHAFTVPA